MKTNALELMLGASATTMRSVKNSQIASNMLKYLFLQNLEERDWYKFNIIISVILQELYARRSWEPQ